MRTSRSRGRSRYIASNVFEKENVSRDGSRIWILCAGKRLGDGSAVEFVLDVTERKRAEEALRQSEARFRAVADLFPDLFWQNDPSGVRTWGNRRWMEYTGQTPDEALGHGWADTIHPDDREGALAAYREVLRSGEPFRHEHRLRRAGGVYRWFLVTAVPVRDDTGSILQWFGVAVDVHDERGARETLAARVAEQTRRVRALAHRLTRYRGLEKAHLGHVATAAAMNLSRLVDWLSGVPRETTRTSRFLALAA
mgnify:CR=1 FL=1